MAHALLHFKSVLFEDIYVSGLLKLRAERRFKWFRNYEVTIFENEFPILTLQSQTQFLEQSFRVTQNQSGFDVQVLNQTCIKIDEHAYRFKVNKLYLLQKHYAIVFVNEEEAGQLHFTAKFPNFELAFYPSADKPLDSGLIKQIAIATLLHISDLDGSE